MPISSVYCISPSRASPTIIFYDQRGRRQIGYEVVGYMNADNFSEHVKEALQGTIGNAI